MTKKLVDSELLETAASAMKYVYDDLVFRAKLAEDDSLNIGQGALDSLLDAKSKLHAALNAPHQDAVAEKVEDAPGMVNWLSFVPFGTRLYTHPAPSVPEGWQLVQKAPIPDDRKDAEICTCRFEKAPCYICGYNGPGYYQPAQHKCAEKYHAAIAAQKGEKE